MQHLAWVEPNTLSVHARVDQNEPSMEKLNENHGLKLNAKSLYLG